MEQCCSNSKQCRNNDATLCCAKNRRRESSRVTRLNVFCFFVRTGSITLNPLQHIVRWPKTYIYIFSKQMQMMEINRVVTPR